MRSCFLQHRVRAGLISLLALFLLTVPAAVGQPVPAPSDVFGFEPGDDYKLADYGQVQDYLEQLDAASDRVQMIEIGQSVLGRPLLLLFISSEENLANLEQWRTISEELARARIDDATARQHVQQGKAIVWIDGGLHASELAHGQMTPQLAYKVATEETPEMQQIREDVILLLMPNMNPDGLDIMAGWYRANLGTPFETTRPPWLYHHYVGHDNNRDWFMNNMPESAAVTRTLYNEWYPQIVYNHHQTSPAWARIFIPPFADPVNPNIHPGVTTSVNMVGTAMANRFAMNNMPGVISDVVFSMWWNGGMRTVPYFHNMVGILTETAHATPTPRYYAPDSLPAMIASRRGSGIPTNGTDIFYPMPWKGGESHFKQPVEYMITASMAVLRLAADLREQWLYNIYRMGRDAIEKSASEGPYAYVLSVDQWDPGEVANLVNVLTIGGVEVHRANEAFEAGGVAYPAGSYVVYGAQAFRPYLTDLLEKQQYPNRRRSPNGPPEPPYDLAGWTLPMQMGVRIDPVSEAFEADVTLVAGRVSAAPGAVSGTATEGYLLSHRFNASMRAVNRLLEAGERVYWAGEAFSLNGADYAAGTVFIEAGRRTEARLKEQAQEEGLDFTGIASRPVVALHALKRPRVGLYKSWVASMDEGWTRWLLEDYAFAVDTLHDADIRTEDLSAYDAIVLPHQRSASMLNGHAAGTMPDAYVGGLGLEGTLALKQYVERGGTLVALDGATEFAITQFGLPIRNVVAGVSSSQFFIPGSLIRIDVEVSHPLAYGMQETTASSFGRSRAFEVVQLSREGEGGREDIQAAPPPPVEVVATYADEDLLMSGWALGAEKHIGGKAAMMRVPLGTGEVILFGFRPQFRGQPRGTYKLFFNALQGATLEERPRVGATSGIE
ncbi:MAG: M14 metallopeptidase family protein [Rhodothermales bacterium]